MSRLLSLQSALLGLELLHRRFDTIIHRVAQITQAVQSNTRNHTKRHSNDPHYSDRVSIGFLQSCDSSRGDPWRQATQCWKLKLPACCQASNKVWDAAWW